MEWVGLVLILLHSSLLICQTYKGKVLDAKDSTPVSYVNIGITQDARGTVSNEDGYFQLGYESDEEIITFSAIGYKTIESKGKQILLDSVIYLEPVTYNIPTIEVIAQRLGKEKIFGVRNKTRGQSIAYGSFQLGSEIGSLIRIPKKTAVTSAHFVLNHAKGDSMLFRVNVYQYVDGNIGPQILKENVYIKDKQKKGTISIDLADLELVLETDVLLTLEWLRDYDELGNKGITFDTKRGKHLKGVYLRKSSNAPFEKLTYNPGKSVCFYFLGREIE